MGILCEFSSPDHSLWCNMYSPLQIELN